MARKRPLAARRGSNSTAQSDSVAPEPWAPSTRSRIRKVA
jgi:hypothetical protein